MTDPGYPTNEYWDAFFSGKRLQRFSTISGGSSGGGAYEESLDLLDDHTFVMASQSSVAVYVQDASGSSAGSQRFAGRWRVVSADATPEAAHAPYFELAMESGETSYLPIAISLSVNGEAYHVSTIE